MMDSGWCSGVHDTVFMYNRYDSCNVVIIISKDSLLTTNISLVTRVRFSNWAQINNLVPYFRMSYRQTGWIGTPAQNEPKAKRDILSRCPDSPPVSRSTPSDVT